jgi:outer membrane protein assembly factor BamB/tetratricopeptide (TPR) repeat protein
VVGTTSAAAQGVGPQRWAFETGDTISSGPTVVAGTVYTGSYDGYLYAVDASTGEEQWRFNAGGSVDSSPTVAGGQVFVGSQNGDLYAVDAETGTPQWEFATGDWIQSSPTVADATVYAGSWDDNLYAVTTNDGDQRWVLNTGGDVTSPAVADDTVYVGSADSTLYAVAAETGTQRWTFEAGDAIESSPAVADETVFVGTSGNSLYAVDTETGGQRWRFEADARLLSSPTVVDETVLIGSDNGTLYAIDTETGVSQWTFQTGARIRTSPAVADDVVFVGSQDSTLYAVGLETGTQQWAFDGEAGISTPAVTDDAVFAGSDDGTLYAVSRPSGFGFGLGTIDPLAVGGTLTATVGGYGVYRFVSGRIGSSDDATDDSLFAPVGDDSDTSEQLAEQLESVNSLLAEARRARDGDRYDAAVNYCDRAIETANAAEETARSAGDDRLSDAQSRLTAAKELKETLVAERETYRSVRDEAETITELINAADNERDAGNQEAALDYFERAEELLTTATTRAEKHDFETITDRLDVARSRCSRIRKLGSNQPSQNSSQTQSRNSARSTSSVPETIPSAPRLSLAYDDIEKEEPIGQGGNADVYRATATTDTQETALAVKEPRMSGTINTDDIDQMLEEADTWQQLDDHEHIVSVVDYGEKPLPWIGMEYMDGGDLGRRIGKLPFKQGLWTAIAITKGVRHAHKMGVAHLDLKPENILFRSVTDAWDVPKVADWGLSKHMLEHSQSVTGLSPQYAAPEQFDPEQFGATDTVTDVYQLGAVFYELFTGQPLFDGETYEIINKVQSETPSPPSQKADLPQELDSILLQAVATDKQDRYEDIILLRNDLLELWDADN